MAHVTVRALRAGATAAVLTDAQAAAVAALARKSARHFGRPQDIEWALEQGRVLLLQSRPITTLAGLADPDGGRRIWDNSNIAESYGGITTPLTFSFARTVYEEVYRQFCVILAVPRVARRRPPRHASRRCSDRCAAGSTTTWSAGIACWRCCPASR